MFDFIPDHEFGESLVKHSGTPALQAPHCQCRPEGLCTEVLAANPHLSRGDNMLGPVTQFTRQGKVFEKPEIITAWTSEGPTQVERPEQRVVVTARTYKVGKEEKLTAKVEGKYLHYLGCSRLGLEIPEVGSSVWTVNDFLAEPKLQEVTQEMHDGWSSCLFKFGVS